MNLRTLFTTGLLSIATFLSTLSESSALPTLPITHTYRDPQTGTARTLTSTLISSELIVQLHPGHTRESLERILPENCRVHRELYGIPAYVVQLPTTTVEELDRYQKAFQRESGIVEIATPNLLRRLSAIPNDPQFKSQWNLHNDYPENQWLWEDTTDCDIDAPEAWDIAKGNKNVIVAVIDTGIDYQHYDLVGNMWINPDEIPNNGIDDDKNGRVDDIHGYNFWKNTADPMDEDGHGTHVAGIIAAQGNNGEGITGVCQDAQLMALKCGYDDGLYLDATISAIYYAVDQGASVINCSYGDYQYNDLEKIALEYAQQHGVTVICSAGNEGVDTDVLSHYPSGYQLSNIISVTGTNQHDQFVDSFNYGAKSVDIAAPGESILSTYPGGKLKKLDGTSMAAPQVAGVAALLKSINPSWQYQQIVSHILFRVDVRSSLANKCSTEGRLNVERSLSQSKVGSFRFASDSYTFDEAKPWNFVTIRRNGALGDASVQVVAQALSAKSPSDYTFQPITVHFNEGQLTRSVLFSPKSDNQIEGSETLQLLLQNPSGTTIANPSKTTITIRDDHPGEIQFPKANFAIYEGKKAQITVIRSGGSYGPASVKWKPIELTADVGVDTPYIPPQGGTLSWKDGESGSKTITISTFDDNETEYTESLLIHLHTATGAKLALGKNSSRLEILDNEPTQIFLDSSSLSTTEGSEKVSFYIRRKGHLYPESRFIVQTHDGTAKKGEDYAQTSTELTFPPHSTGTFPFSIGIEPDEIEEPKEYFYVQLIPIQGCQTGNPGYAKIHILDGKQSGFLTFEQEEESIVETEEYMLVYVDREGGSDQAVSVDYEITPGTALYNIDFFGELSGTLHWKNNEGLPQTIQISFAVDNIAEPTETIHIMLKNPQGAGLGEITETTILLSDGVDPIP